METARTNLVIMVTFIGEYTAKVDDRGRLVFPSAFKNLLSSDSDQRFVIKKNMFLNCLDMFTFAEWERQSAEVYSKLNIFNKKHAAFWDRYTRERDVVIPDAKLGRLSIQKNLLDSIGVTKEVVFAGKDFKIQIWDKDSYESGALTDDEFLEIADELSQQR